ncbi:MAG TPA: S41 family peptidase [Candidatus Paceibacterota bacterium]|nr:S41 family peptidase [Candidatus Paceibacterota bacterium]HMO83176.1 S41 family peptidase [Candidatus Paceibacterota bacterium]
MSEQQDNQLDTTSDKKTLRKNNLLGIFLALFLAAGSFISGTQVDKVNLTNSQTAGLFSFFSRPLPNTPATEADLSQFWRVWELMDKKFVAASTSSSITAEDKVNGAIEGMVKAYGDPYTAFLPPVESAAFAEDISGNFSGVGMEIGIRNDLITIIAPLPGTPAERAGLLPGDIITEIDGKTTDRMRVDEAVRLIRGEKGTEVVLSVYREGNLEIKTYPVIRDTIDIPTIATEKVDDVFIIRLFSFNALSEMKTQEALREYTRSGAKKLVLDLRGNPGGYLQSAVAIASYFLPTGKVVVKESYRETDMEKLYRSTGRTIHDFNNGDFVVLIDGGSASASEILAGALREHEIATLIGVNSFGKGSVQELVSLPEGSSVKITVARWLTPHGISISEGGLKPDIVIARTPEDRLNAKDPQQAAAIRFLKGEEVVSE